MSFYNGWPDGDALYAFEPTLFHLPEHLALQQPEGWQAFYAVAETRKRIVASLFVNVSDKKGTTAVRSPYGDLECADDISAETLFSFIKFADDELSRQADSIEIKMKPSAYAPRAHAQVFSFLHAVGFRTTGVDISSCIHVSGDFEGAIRKNESQVLHKAVHAGFTASLMAADKLSDAYAFIARHHQKKNYPVSMTWTQLLQTSTLFRERYLTFGVHTGETMVAAAIAIRVSDRVLNLFYIDHDSQYDKYSPPVLLIAALFDYCAMNHIPLLDLGTSSLPDGPNIGLLSFKIRMGAQPSVKPTLSKIYRHG